MSFSTRFQTTCPMSAASSANNKGSAPVPIESMSRAAARARLGWPAAVSQLGELGLALAAFGHGPFGPRPQLVEGCQGRRWPAAAAARQSRRAHTPRRRRVALVGLALALLLIIRLGRHGEGALHRRLQSRAAAAGSGAAPPWPVGAARLRCWARLSAAAPRSWRRAWFVLACAAAVVAAACFEGPDRLPAAMIDALPPAAGSAESARYARLHARCDEFRCSTAIYATLGNPCPCLRVC